MVMTELIKNKLAFFSQIGNVAGGTIFPPNYRTGKVFVGGYEAKLMERSDINNILDDQYPVDVHFLSGKVNDPGAYYSRNVGFEYSGTYFDNPWMSATGREINFSIGIEFN